MKQKTTFRRIAKIDVLKERPQGARATDGPSQSERLIWDRKKQEDAMAMKDDVQAALDKTRPFLQRDGGDVELIDVTDDGVVKVRLKGACGGCPMATMTLKSMIEKTIMTEVPAVKTVESVA